MRRVPATHLTTESDNAKQEENFFLIFSWPIYTLFSFFFLEICLATWRDTICQLWKIKKWHWIYVKTLFYHFTQINWGTIYTTLRDTAYAYPLLFKVVISESHPSSWGSVSQKPWSFVLSFVFLLSTFLFVYSACLLNSFLKFLNPSIQKTDPMWN